MIDTLIKNQPNFKKPIFYDKLNLLNPEAQLERGYALAINEKGKVMYNAKDIAVDDEFKLKLAHGQLQAKVLTKRNDDV